MEDTEKKNTEKMTQEVAQAEFDKWIYETKRLRARAVEKHADSCKSFVDALCDGTLAIEEDGSVIQKLQFEVAGRKQLKYKPRLTVAEMANALDYKGGDGGKTRKMVSILTDEVVGVLDKMDSADWALANSITAFYFLA